MGLSQVIPNSDFRGLRVALPELNVPPYTTGIEGMHVASKYTELTGILVEPNTPDATKDFTVQTFGAQAINPQFRNPTQLGGKDAIYFRIDASPTRTKTLSRAINHSGNKFSMSFIFANQDAVVLTQTRILFHIQMANGNSLAFQTSGTNSKMAIVVNGTRTELLAAAALSTAYKIRIEYNAGTLKVYVNNVIDTILNGQAIQNFIGTFYLGSNNLGTNTSQMHGYLGSLYTWKRNFTDAEGTVIHNFLTAAYL